MSWVLLNTWKHASRAHAGSVHALLHADAWWATVHLVRAEWGVLLSHGRRHHVVLGHGLRTVGLSAHRLSRSLRCLCWHSVLVPWHADGSRRHARRLHGLGDLGCVLSFGSSRSVWLDRRLVGSLPDIVEVVFAMLALLLELLVDFSCLRSCVEDLAGRGWPCQVLIGGALHLMSRPLNATVVSGLQVSRCAVVCVSVCGRHASWCGVETTERLQRVNGSTEVVLVVAGVCSWMSKGHGTCVVGFGCGCLSCFCSTWPLLARSVLLGKTLLPSLALPVVVAHAPAVDDQSASELSEHGSGSHYGNLSGSV